MSWKVAPIGRGGDLLYSQAGTPSLDLRFAETKSLTDYVSAQNLITFSRGSSATYVDSDGLIKTATTNEARFDHDPTTGESLGLLVEEARTNLIYPSTLPSTNNGTFIVGGAAIQTNAGLAPDGTFTASLVNFDLGTGNNRFFFFTGGVLRDETYSFYIKSASPGSVFAFNTVGAMTSVSGYFDFDAEALTGSTSAITVVNYSNGWYKISFTSTILTTVSSSAYIQIRPLAFGTGSFYTWGWQREVGSFPTSYIPTEGSTVTRAADVAQLTGTNFSSFYNQSEGTVFYEWENFNPSNQYIVLALTTTGVTDSATSIAAQRIRIDSNNTMAYGCFSAENTTIGLGSGSYAGNTPYKTSFAYKQNDFFFAKDGLGASSSSGSPDLRIDRMTLMSSREPGSTSGIVSRLTYYPVRLPDATLQTITS